MGNGLTIFSHLQDLKSSIELRLDASGGGKFGNRSRGICHVRSWTHGCQPGFPPKVDGLFHGKPY